jgi:hypothetical protein
MGYNVRRTERKDIMMLYLPVLGEHPDTENTRPSYVVEDFERLTAPVTGTVTLPVVLDWTPKKNYDRANPRERKRLYELVLAEAHSEEDIERHINGEALQEVWDELHIPRRVRYAWESVHPQLGLKKYR